MKAVYITNRGGTHPNRKLYFDSIHADYQFVDFRIPWHSRPSSRFRMILSGIVCAFTFPNRTQYDLFVTSDPQIPAVLMKLARRLSKKQKVVSYLGSQTLYFIYDGYFSKATRMLNIFLLKQYDAHICNGPLQAKLLQEVAGIPSKKIFTNFNGVQSAKLKKLQAITYNPESQNLLFVGNIYSSWRSYYKGLDLILEAFNELKKYAPRYILTVVGEYDDSLPKTISKFVEEPYRADIILVGKVPDIIPFLNDVCLYIHPSRGDALPNSLTESLCAGIPAVVSNVTGGCETVAEIDEQLVCELDANSVVRAVRHFLELPPDVKVQYSATARKLTAGLTAEAAVEEFNSIISQIRAL